MGIMVHHQVKQHLHYRSPKRRGEKGTDNLFKETMTENFPDLERDMAMQIHKASEIPKQIQPKELCNRDLKNQRKTENFESKKKKTYYIQGNPNKVLSDLSADTS